MRPVITEKRKHLYTRFLLFLSFAGLTVFLNPGCGMTSHREEIALDSNRIELPSPGHLPPGEKAALEQKCEEWFDTMLGNTHFNGGLLVAKDGNIIFEKYRGTLDGSADSIGTETPLHIASITKTFTAMAILKLMQEGRLNLDDTLTRFFPGFNYDGVTVKTLLNHRSGLPNYLYFMEDFGWNKQKFITNRDVLNYMVKFRSEMKNVVPPDKSFSYCNTNYVLLALVIEATTGKSYPQYMHENFFKPLGMENTFVFSLADTARIPPSYDWRGTAIPYNFLDESYGDKNIYSTPRDLLTWDRALKANVIFSPETLNKAFTAYSNEKPGIRNYGLGWRMNIYPEGKKLIFHTGWWHGNNSIFIRLPEENATIIALGNRYTRAVYKAKNLAGLFDEFFAADTTEEQD